MTALASEILEAALRPPDVGAEFAARQAIDVLVPVAVTRDLVALGGNRCAPATDVPRRPRRA